MLIRNRKTLNSILIAVLFVILAVAVDKTSGQGGACTTQRNVPGTCVPILTCKTITELLRDSPRPLPESVANFVRKSYCGTFDSVRHVCCEQHRVTVQTMSGTTAPISDTTTKAPFARPGVEKSEEDVRAGLNILQKNKCGTSDADRVANGEDAKLSEYPWMALLIYDDGITRTLDCGGSLIHERYVLTAAHCIRSRKRLVSVRLGEHDTESDEDCIGSGERRKCAPPIQEIDIEQAIFHKNYSPTKFSNDIGLLRLVSNAVILSNVKPICLPVTAASRRFNLERMIVSGWGNMESGHKATILQKAIVPLVSQDVCQEAFSFIKITAEQICAGGVNEVDACKGDSGGPLFYSAPFKRAPRYIQYGVVSAGTVACGTNTPGIYVRVEAYLPWIASNIY